MAEKLESGDIYFFYRTKMDVEKASSIKDVQRLYMILVPDENSKSRMIIVGRKRLPKISNGNSTRKDWCMVVSIGKPAAIGRELHPVEYETKTKGKQQVAEAIPAAEGRYSLAYKDKDNSSRLLYKIKHPEKFGKAQEELGILPEASYVISVKNPKINVKGFPDERPSYPKTLVKQFADERWLSVKKPKLLDYENVQLLLIGANEDLEDEELRVTGKPNLFKKLELEKSNWPTKTLFQGLFDKVKRNPKPIQSESDRTKGGRRGGIEAVKTASASGVAKTLKGISFPKNRSELVAFAKDHRAKAEIIDLLEHLPKKHFKTMADVQKAVGEVR